MMKISIITQLSIFLLYPFIGHSQTTTYVSGTIYSSATRQTIQGASIVNKSTGKVLISSEKGQFTFQNVSQSDTLAFTFVGYIQQEIPIASIGVGALEVFLEPSNKLIDEVVVNTGYQSIPKERATGSFTQIDKDLFNRSVSADLISRLEGVTNGLSYELPRTEREPSSTPNLRVRGLSTIDGETEPLIVVDNFPYEGNINNINPNDVQSITILKDAAAASIWGARAGNGVIVITTKNGIPSNKPAINFNGNLNITEKPDLFYDMRFLPPSEVVELERILFGQGLYAKNDWTAFTPAVEILFAHDEGRIDQVTANRMLEDLKQYDIRDDASKYLYRHSINQQYAINLNGGNENNQYYVSAGFDNNAGNLIGDGYERITLTAKNDIQIIPKLRIGAAINYANSKSQNNGIGLLEIAPSGMTAYPVVYTRLADEGGNPLPVVRNNRYAYTDNAPTMGLLDWHYRPIDEIRINDNTSGSQEVRLNTSIRYQALRDLNLEVRYQYQNVGNSTRTHYTEDSYFARNLINQFTQVDGTRPVPLGGILNKGGNTFKSHYGRFQMDYDGGWGQFSELNGLAGFELRQEQSIGIGSSRLYGYDDNVLTHVTNLNFDSSFQVRPRSSGRIPYGNSPGNQTTDRFVSYYVNLAYSYARKYILSGSARWDASNIFGVDFNKKGVPLWSIGGAWNISNEQFFAIDWINLAKLRMTYGSNGNAVPALSSLPYIRFGSTNVASRLPSAQLMSAGNPDLSWERVNTINLGLDISLINNRLFGSIEWYKKNSSNLIGRDFIDPTTGIIEVGSSYNLDNRRNYADMATNGVDIELNTVNVDKGVKWQTVFLFSHIANKITNYNNPRNPLITDFFAPYVTPVIEGVSRDQLYALPWHGLDNTGSPLVMVGGELSTDYNTYFNNLMQDDLIRVGVSLPSYFGSVRNSVTWRSLSLGFNLLWKGGYKFRRESNVYNYIFSSRFVNHTDYLNRWKAPGDELKTHVPSMPEGANLRRDQAYMYSEALIEKGDHIRLQDINLSYQLPHNYASGIGLSQVKLYAYAKNLGILWKYTDLDIDPDVRALYPQPFQLAFGLQIQL